ncbi:hypothetical protein GE107_09220 [Cohnella sp. CFH 77786]|uniref:DUF6022 family protein n=1 Tax=Cohnella sp. CFH 77786 TaxID=2662265 RepID=UPI001C60F9EA|nr:DUF6022 family protein [Cohnella sp. CFH 77786]MBW5446238.1 hypothetical protein [Cohnella sp. CFH 77786]
MTPSLIASLVRSVDPILNASWRTVLEDKKDELAEMFEKFGDRAYGVWIHHFMTPVIEHLTAEGYLVKGGFNRANSVESWGPPEERERCAWYVVRHGDGTPLGTMILQVYHSHKSFRLPRAPRLLPMEAVDRDAILEALSRAATRVRWDLPEERLPGPDDPKAAGIRWEYASDIAIADALHPADDGQRYSWTLDQVLADWGRYGWELVSVVPRGNDVVAFFKRPMPA